MLSRYNRFCKSRQNDRPQQSPCHRDEQPTGEVSRQQARLQAGQALWLPAVAACDRRQNLPRLDLVGAMRLRPAQPESELIMTRKTFLKSLAATPLATFFKPKSQPV